MKKKVVLFDLPTYPKGVLSLSLIALASNLKPFFDVTILDLNLLGTDVLRDIKFEHGVVMYGLKVSAQNFRFAIELTQTIKSKNPNIPVVWGGELPTLLPDKCLNYATCIVAGLFEPIAGQFVSDLQSGSLNHKYSANIKDNNFDKQNFIDYSTVKNLQSYYTFMGLPLETSRGCTEKCTFCMVHTMQRVNYSFKNKKRIKEELSGFEGHFINVIDYNLGVNEQHVFDVAEAIKNSGALGWMAEMCIESLDNDKILQALSDSRCKIVYCGLETIDEKALHSIHKMNTNHISNYERIIQKAQSYGVQVAAGVILGVEGMKYETFERLLDFFTSAGIIYAKLTFLTYNPGTKSQKYMSKRGTFLSDEIEFYDGNHLTFIHTSDNSSEIYRGATRFISKFYSLRTIISRSFNINMSTLQRLDFILFNFCYRQVYLDWIKHNIFKNNANFNMLLSRKFNKKVSIQVAERLLLLVRKIQLKNE